MTMQKNVALAEAFPVFTPDDYLNFERFASERHEFLDGRVYAMAGESPNHSTICFNLSGSIRAQLRGKGCRGYSPNMKIATGESGLYSYPDLVVVCGKPVYHDDKGDVLTNPRVIFEVLSPSTASYDRGEKFMRYTNYIHSLEDYILVSQDKPLVERFSRSSGWAKTDIEGLDAVLRLDSVECDIDLADLYDLVEF